MRFARPIALAAAALLTISGLARCHAASLEVVPTTIQLPAAGGPAKLRLVNHGNAPVSVQIEAMSWTQAGSESLSDSDEISFSPPFARLDPHGSQIVRFLLSPSPAGEERAFRVIVTQLPEAYAGAGAKVLLQFSVPVFEGDGGTGDVIWSLHRDDDGFRLDARNTGPAHAKFTDLVLIDAAGARKPVSPQRLVYVLAASVRSWRLRMPAGDTFRLEGNDEISRGRVSVPISVSNQ
jgi:fimbrial chaperone protein